MTDLSKPPRPDEIKRSLAEAIRERRFEYVQPLLSVLARTSPADAEAVYEAMLAALPDTADHPLAWQRPEVTLTPDAQMSLFSQSAA